MPQLIDGNWLYLLFGGVVHEGFSYEFKLELMKKIYLLTVIILLLNCNNTQKKKEIQLYLPQGSDEFVIIRH